MSRVTLLTAVLPALLIATLPPGVTGQEAAGLESECQSEAAMYEVPPEQRAEYVAGCIASRGGYPSVPSAEEDSASEYAEDFGGEPGEPPPEEAEGDGTVEDYEP